jgi:DNA polymerase-3 subunit beta
LKRAIEHTLFSTAEGNVRPTLAGIHLKVNADGSAAFASTDSFRLSEFVLKNASTGGETAGIIIPAKTAAELSRILSEDGTVELFVSENQLLATYGNIKLFSRLLNGHFPDYRNFFPKKHSTRGVVLRADIVQALRRMNLISKENNFNTKVAFRSDSGLDISTGDTEIGAGRGSVPASVEGEDGTIGLNSTYLLEALSVIKEDYVSIDFETSLSPVVVRGVPAENDKQSFRHIIMPLKI